jgi:2-polyprenyl-3-methyl-5-hydroxy-6-metoxy-1,4-benzoquinol methylase
MMAKNTDKDWEIFGQMTPYFGVISDEKFMPENLDESAIKDFFASGEQHVEEIVSAIKHHIKPDFAPERCLDFGCGVGRLVFPLAGRFPHVVGVDVSRSMIEEARRNSEQRGIANVEFIESDDELSKVKGMFDFIHSYIVMQHIQPKRGERLLQRLIEILNAGGVAALHFNYSWDGWLQTATRKERFARWLRESVPLAHNFINLAKGRKFNHPFMFMNNYDLNKIFSIIQDCGCQQAHVSFTSHDGHWGMMILFQK